MQSHITEPAPKKGQFFHYWQLLYKFNDLLCFIFKSVVADTNKGKIRCQNNKLNL